MLRVDGRQPFRYAPERPTTGKVRFARYTSTSMDLVQLACLFWRFLSPRAQPG